MGRPKFRQELGQLLFSHRFHGFSLKNLFKNQYKSVSIRTEKKMSELLSEGQVVT